MYVDCFVYFHLQKDTVGKSEKGLRYPKVNLSLLPFSQETWHPVELTSFDTTYLYHPDIGRILSAVAFTRVKAIKSRSLLVHRAHNALHLFPSPSLQPGRR